MPRQADCLFESLPCHLPWTPENLREMDPVELDGLARGAGRSLVMGRLLLGRCLVELDRRTLWDEWGFSGSIHYARYALRLSRKEAREMRRVARELELLPVLSAAAEQGDIGWSHLREVVRVAVPETEEAWLEAAQTCTWRVFHRLVRQAVAGDLPGEVSQDAEAEQVELRFLLTVEQAEVYNAGMARLSRRFGRLVDPAEALEYAFAELLAGSDTTLESRLQQARELLEDMRHVRDRQQRTEDARARSAAFRNWRRTRCCAPAGEGEAALGDEDQAAEESRPTWVEDHEQAAEDGGTACSVHDEQATAGARPTWAHDGQVREDARPAWVAGDQQAPRLPFAYPAPKSGDGLLRDGPAGGEMASAPRIGWEMVSAGQARCPDNPDLWLLSAERRPFWVPPAEPAPAPAADAPDRLGRRQEAIQRGAWTRRGSAEPRRAVQRRDGFACMCPDCPHIAWLHAHHLALYFQGGLSVPSGMVLLCSKCHRNVHRGTLRIHGTPETGLDWRDARGLPLGQAEAATRQRSLRHAALLAAAAAEEPGGTDWSSAPDSLGRRQGTETRASRRRTLGGRGPARSWTGRTPMHRCGVVCGSVNGGAVHL
jgi:5-methylcytosine-specific restriction endonuclease McrA